MEISERDKDLRSSRGSHKSNLKGGQMEQVELDWHNREKTDFSFI